MKKIVALLTKEKWLRMNGNVRILTFLERYTMYIKKLGQFFFHIYSLTCLKKDTPFMLKVLNI